MELLGLAILFFLCRTAVDIAHAVKGTEPPHLVKARMKTQAAPSTKERSPYAAGKPRVRDVAAAMWGNALEDVLAASARRRVERAAQHAENEQAAAENREPRRIRPRLRDRAKRLWALVTGGAPGPMPTREQQVEPEAPTATVKQQRTTDEQEKPMPDTPSPVGILLGLGRPPSPAERAEFHGQPAPSASAPTGEAVNYETAMAELDKLEEAQRAHLEKAQAALDDVRAAKAHISDTQATYRPAAEAATGIHESLTALNLDQETVANTGTIADAMPPNEVDVMFARLEEMEAVAQQQVANAETALAHTDVARKSIVEKYGDAHTTVQGHLSGDSRFLSGGSTAAPAPVHRDGSLASDPSEIGYARTRG
jgi:hypothetical protein